MSGERGKLSYRQIFPQNFAQRVKVAAGTASAEEMKAAKLPVSYRDYCGHLLIPLNKCRQETFYMPFKCMDERHEYEKCQWVEYVDAFCSGSFTPCFTIARCCRHLKAVKRKMDQ